jgi:spore coat protein A
MNRRDFLKLGAAAGAAVMAPKGWLLSTPRARGGTASVPNALGYANAHKFTSPLPRPRRVDMTRGGALQVDIVQLEQQVLDDIYPATTVWGYQVAGGPPSYPGATIVAKSNRRINVHWRNRLPRGHGAFPESHLLPVDMLGHMAEPYKDLPQGNIPVVTHLHGGHTEADSDGGPEQWFTQNQSQKGPDWKKSIYKYDNDQPAATCWYHDHALGITRLNVYAGLAGFYLIRDDNELGLIASGVIPGDPYEVELAIQDRDFSADGQLLLQTTADPVDGRVPTTFPDFILVNGKPWPYLDVEPRKYRFRILNGSDGRVYRLRLHEQQPDGSDVQVAGSPFLQLGTELGLLGNAQALDQILLATAERYDVVIDFSQYAGRNLILRNLGTNGIFRGFNNPTNEPHGPLLGGGVNAASDGLVMMFRVNQTLSSVPNASVSHGTALGGGGTPPGDPTYTRQLALIQGNDNVVGGVPVDVPPWPRNPNNNAPLGRITELQGTLDGGAFLYHEPLTETPALGSVEMWEIYNTTFPAHPIHIHLVNFEVVNRQKITSTVTRTEMHYPDGDIHHMHGDVMVLGGKATVSLVDGTTRGPEPQEQGRKDTVICYPGEVTRVRAHFDRPGGYVWHCHILHHEDHDMMRPFVVT